jgi:hypothetical protein
MSVEGRARPRVGTRPAALVATYAPDRHRDAVPRHRATLSSRSAPEKKVARERPGPPACTVWSAKSPSSARAGAPRRPKDLTDIGTRGRAEDTRPYARPGSGRVPGGAHSDLSIGGSRRVDDGNVTHHKPAREYEQDDPPGPRIRGEGGHLECPGSGRGRRGQRRGVGDEYREVKSRAGAFIGPAGRPRRRRADVAKSESDRVRGREVGMVSIFF